jgi:hypothetical protein
MGGIGGTFSAQSGRAEAAEAIEVVLRGGTESIFEASFLLEDPFGANDVCFRWCMQHAQGSRPSRPWSRHQLRGEWRVLYVYLLSESPPESGPRFASANFRAGVTRAA